MSNSATRRAARENFLPLLRVLARTYQAFTDLDAAGYRESGSELTVAQADVVFTLGNTPGMTCKEIGERTLITKGTLTGVIDRLADKGLVSRAAEPNDRRCVKVKLTAKGERLFEKEFPRQVGWLKQRLASLSQRDIDQAVRALNKLQDVL